MDLRKLDYALLALVFVLQGKLALRLSSVKTVIPVFSGYLWIVLLSFMPWVLDDGPSKSLLWNVFIAGAKIGTAIEGAYLAMHLTTPIDSGWQRTIPFGCVIATVAVLFLASPAPYPEYPATTFYVRIAGHLAALAIAVGTLIYAWDRRMTGLAVKHVGLLAIYFGAMLVAAASSPKWRMETHCGLMVVHAGCMVGWLAATRGNPKVVG